MKYTDLLQIAKFFENYNKIESIKRLDDNIFQIFLDKEAFIFDLTRSASAIYQASLEGRTYNAPFDVMLKKYLTNAKITRVFVPKNNRILCFETLINKAYKSYQNKIYFEFTGKNTNAIITDEKDTIIEALRHISKGERIIEVGRTLAPLKPFEINEKSVEISNFKAYFEQVFLQKNAKKLEILKQNKALQVSKKIMKLKELLNALENEKDLEEKALKRALMADILFANLSQIKSFEREFTLKDFEDRDVKFKLIKEAKLSANDYYKEAKKLKQRAKNIHLQRANLNEKIEFLNTLLELVLKAQSAFELEILAPKKEKKEKKEERQNVAQFYYDGFKICVGKNETANEYLLKNSKKDDIWLHVKDLPSAHTFIVSNKTSPSTSVLNFAAKLCVSFSNLSKGSYLIDYTSRKFVKIRQKALVDYTNYKTLKFLKD